MGSFGGPPTAPRVDEPTLVSSQLGAGQDPSMQILMQTLAQIQALQRQPAGPTNPLQGLGAVLQGGASGYKNEPNPTLQYLLQEKGQQMHGLGQQLQGQLGLANYELHAQDQVLRERMEMRRLQHEAEANARNERVERMKIRMGLASDLIKVSGGNSLVLNKGLKEMEALYKENNIPVPPGGFTASGLNDIEKNGKKVAMAIIQLPHYSDAEIAAGTDSSLDAVQGIRTIMTTPGPQRDLFMKTTLGQTYGELEADALKAEGVAADVKKKRFDLGIQQRELALLQKPTRGPDEERELYALRNLKGAPNEVRDLTQRFMDTEKLPYELAVAKAERVIAEAQNQSDFKTVVRGFMEKNPGMSEADAVLAAHAQVKAAKSDFAALETQVDTMKDFVSRLEEYSREVNTHKSQILQKGHALIRYGGSYIMNDIALEGLMRKQGELANVMRFLGEKGVISDRDITRGQMLLPTIWKTGPIAQDSIRELKEIVKRSETNLARRRGSATAVPGPAPAAPAEADPSNPLRLTR